jgi:alkylation response protein AidB-like acyl-CoA dehydrogenase
MNFRLNEDELALQTALRRFCDERLTLETWRKLETPTGSGFDKGLWKMMSQLGVFGLRVAEDKGGPGLGMTSAVLAFVELGRRLAPGPIVWSHLAANIVEGAAEGEAVVGGLDALSAPILVEHAESLKAFLVLRSDGVYRLGPADLKGEDIESLDPLTPLRLVAELPKGERIGGVPQAEALRLEGTILSAALLAGIAEATVELAVTYSKTREQFGRAIGSFQALKHIMADMVVRKEVARAAVYAAGATFDDPTVGDVDAAARAAKLTAGEAALKNARACIQVHGGMGYTWEAAPQYYFKRACVLDTVFGTPAEHAAASAQAWGG